MFIFLRGGLFEKVPLELPSKLFKTFGLWLNSFLGLLSMREAPAEAGPKSRLTPARGRGAHRTSRSECAQLRSNLLNPNLHIYNTKNAAPARGAV